MRGPPTHGPRSTQNELERRELFPDRVAYGGWIIDDHTQGGVLEPSKAPSFDKADVELIRCLCADKLQAQRLPCAPAALRSRAS